MSRIPLCLLVSGLSACAQTEHLPPEVGSSRAGGAHDSGSPEVPDPSLAARSTWWETVQSRLAVDARQITMHDRGPVAWMPATGARARFSSEGVRLGAARSDHPLQLRFSGWSRGEVGWSIEPTVPALGDCAGETDVAGSCTRRLEYAHPGLVEWWVGQDRGIELGWTVEHAPAGDGDLRFEVEVQGADWMESTGDGAELTDAAGRAWTVSPATAWDANGDPLSAWIEVEADRFIVGVDVAGAAWPVTVDPIVSTASWTGSPSSSAEFFGHAAEGAGDLNGDGYSDVIVGAYQYGSSTGRAYVFHGSLNGLDTTAAQVITGGTTGDMLGYRVSEAGDVNKDGYDDVLITSYGYDSYRGRVDVYHGSSSGIGSSPSRTLTGGATSDYFGLAIAGAGDIDADGYDDIAIGAPNYDTVRGMVSVFHGSSSGIGSTADLELVGPTSMANYGRVLSEGGDINGDGYADLLVYSATAQRVEVFHGSSTGLGSSADSTLSSAASSSGFGFGLSGVGDVDGDGYDDILIGEPYYSSNLGRAHIHLGSASGVISAADVTITSSVASGYFGIEVSAAGDLNGDGYPELAIGLLGYSGFAGQVLIYQSSPVGVVSTPVATVSGTTSNEYLGYAISGAGDVNGDGYDDLLIGSYGYNAYDGRAEVFLGFEDADGDGFIVGGDGSDPDCDDADPTVGGATTWYADLDGDGYGDAADSIDACTAPSNYVSDDTDCDDTRVAVNPGATEVCDSADLDEDCSGLADDLDTGVDTSTHTTWYADSDSDGYGDPATSTDACDVPTGYVADATDCDDSRADVSPAAPEVCDSADVDEDCDGVADNDDTDADAATFSTWYADADEDGYGNVAAPTETCDVPAGYVADYTDCDDTRADVNPAQVEICDDEDTDEDCSTLADDQDPDVDTSTYTAWYADTDGDGYGDRDNSTGACDQPDGYLADEADCDDTRADVNPDGVEVCDDDDADEDCNGDADNDDADADPTTMTTWYADADEDGYGDLDTPTDACDLPDAHVEDSTDCDDTRADVSPEGLEICDADDTDEDCDGLVDDADDSVDTSTFVTAWVDADGDGYGDPDAPQTACDPDSSTVDNDEDCDDTDPEVYPGADDPTTNRITDCDELGDLDDDATGGGAPPEDKSGCATVSAASGGSWLAVLGLCLVAVRRRGTETGACTIAR